jgi:serine/threonine protein kinase
MRLTVGEHLGHYEIHALLGAGGMGEVHRATDTMLGREVALKVLPAEMGRVIPLDHQVEFGQSLHYGVSWRCSAR